METIKGTQKSGFSSKQKHVWQDKIFNVVVILATVFMLLVTLYPLYLIIISSVSDANLVSLGQVTLYPKGFNLSGYRAIFANNSIWRAYLNSIVYTLLGTAISIGVTMGAAFVLTRKFPGSKAISFLFVFTMFFNGGLIPTFLVVRDLGLYNNPWICILMGCVSVWNVMVARTYITSTIPESLYEAATLDGASDWMYFSRIVLPLSGTIVAVLSVYYGVAKWNDYWTGLVYITKEQYLPLQTVLKQLLASLEMSAELNVMAGELVDGAAERMQRAQLAKYGLIVVSTAPAVVLYLFMQDFFVKGVMIGSVKG